MLQRNTRIFLQKLFISIVFFVVAFTTLPAFQKPVYAESCTVDNMSIQVPGTGPWGFGIGCDSANRPVSHFGYDANHTGGTPGDHLIFYDFLIRCTGTTASDWGDCTGTGGYPITPANHDNIIDGNGYSDYAWTTTMSSLDTGTGWYQYDLCWGSEYPGSGPTCTNPTVGFKFFYQAPGPSDTQAPTCNYLTLSTATVSEGANQTVTVRVSVKDNIGVHAVELFRNSIPIPETNPFVLVADSPDVTFNFLYNTSSLTAGTYKIIANANDNANPINTMRGLDSGCAQDLVVVRPPTPQPTQDPNAKIEINWTNNCSNRDTKTCPGNQASVNITVTNKYPDSIKIRSKTQRYWCRTANGAGGDCQDNSSEDNNATVDIASGQSTTVSLTQAIGKSGTGTGTCGSGQVDWYWERIDATGNVMPEDGAGIPYWGYAYDSNGDDCTDIIPTPTTNPACASGTCSACALKEACPGSGIQTYDTCIDNTPDPNPSGTSLSYRQGNYTGNPPTYNPNFCKNATKFRCYASDASTACVSNPGLTISDANYYNYSCTACQVPTPSVSPPPTPVVVSAGCTIYPLINGVSASWHITIPKEGSGTIPSNAEFHDNQVHSVSATQFSRVGCSDTECGIRTPEYWYGPSTTVTGSYSGGGKSCSHTFSIGAPPAARCEDIREGNITIAAYTFHESNFDRTQWPVYKWDQNASSGLAMCQSSEPEPQVEGAATSSSFWNGGQRPSSPAGQEWHATTSPESDSGRARMTGFEKVFLTAKGKAEKLLKTLTQDTKQNKKDSNQVLSATTGKKLLAQATTPTAAPTPIIFCNRSQNNPADGSNPACNDYNACTNNMCVEVPDQGDRCYYPPISGNPTCGTSPNGGNMYCYGGTCSDTSCNSNLNQINPTTTSQNPECEDGNTCTINTCTPPYNDNDGEITYYAGIGRCAASQNQQRGVACKINPTDTASNGYCTGPQTTPSPGPSVCSNSLCRTNSECNDNNNCTNDACIGYIPAQGGNPEQIGACDHTNLAPTSQCELDQFGNPTKLCSSGTPSSIQGLPRFGEPGFVVSTCSVTYNTCPNTWDTPSTTNNRCCGTTNIQGRACAGECNLNAVIGSTATNTVRPQQGIVVTLKSDICNINQTKITDSNGAALFNVPVGKGSISRANFQKFRYEIAAQRPLGMQNTRGSLLYRWWDHNYLYTTSRDYLAPNPNDSRMVFNNVQGTLVGGYVIGKALQFGFEGNVTEPVCNSITAQPTSVVLPSASVNFSMDAATPINIVNNWSPLNTSIIPNDITGADKPFYRNGKVYFMGTTSQAQETSIYATAVNSNNTLSSWEKVGAIPQRLWYSSVQVYNDYLIVIGGYSNSIGPLSSVYAAKFLADGSLGSFNELTPLPETRYNAASVIVSNGNDYLYVIGSNGGNQDTRIIATKLSYSGTNLTLEALPGSSSVWTPLIEPPAAVYPLRPEQISYLATPEGSIIGMGDKNYASNKIYKAQVTSNGTLTPWQTLQNAPGGILNAAINNGYIYATSSQSIYSAPITTGEIGSWQTFTDSSLYYHSAPIIGNGKIVFLANPNSYTIVPVDITNGTVQKGTAMLNEFNQTYNPTAFTTNNHIIITGGRNSFILSNGYQAAESYGTAEGNTFIAKRNTDGSLSPWRYSPDWKLQTSDSKPLENFATASHNNRLYAIGGQELTFSWGQWYPTISATEVDTIYTTQIQADDTITPWQSIGTLPETLKYAGAVVYNGYLIVAGGIHRESGQDTTSRVIRYAKIQSNGSLDPWKLLPEIPSTSYGYFKAFVYNDRLYIVSEQSSDKTIYMSTISFTGDGNTPLALDTWQNLPVPFYLYKPFINNGYFFTNDISGGTTRRYTAKINSNGTLGQFAPIKPFPWDFHPQASRETTIASLGNNIYAFTPWSALANLSSVMGTVDPANATPIGNITNYFYNFGDGVSSPILGQPNTSHLYTSYGQPIVQGYAKNDQGIWSNACTAPVNVTCPVMQIRKQGDPTPITSYIELGPGDKFTLEVSGIIGNPNDTIWSTSSSTTSAITIENPVVHPDPTFPPYEPESSLFIASIKKLWSKVANNTAFASHTIGKTGSSVTIIGRPLPAGETEKTGILFVQGAGTQEAVCPAGYQTIAVKVKPYTIKGAVYVDKNKNKVKDTDEEVYTGGPITIRAIRNDRPLEVAAEVTSTNGLYTLTNLGVLTGHTIQYINPAGGYYSVFPPSFTHTDIKVGSECSIPAGLPQPTEIADQTKCTPVPDQGNIINLNIGMTPLPWFQGKGGDMRIDSGFTDRIPAGALAGGVSAPYASLKNRTDGTGTPGIIFSGDQNYYFGQGFASEDQFKWIAGGTTYKEIFKSANQGLIRTSYDYLMDVAKQNNITRKNLGRTTGSGTNDRCEGGNIGSCNFPPSLESGVYHADGDLTMKNNQDYTFPANKNFVILVKGNLTLTKNMLVPYGSTVLFSVKGDIIVDKEVGVSSPAIECQIPTSTGGISDSNKCNLEGFFSTDKSFIIKGNTTFVSEDLGSECTTVKDKRLNIGGVVITNAGLTGGYLQNQRDLCEDDKKYPPVSIVERPDFIINAPTFLKRPNFVWQEVAP